MTILLFSLSVSQSLSSVFLCTQVFIPIHIACIYPSLGLPIFLLPCKAQLYKLSLFHTKRATFELPRLRAYTTYRGCCMLGPMMYIQQLDVILKQLTADSKYFFIIIEIFLITSNPPTPSMQIQLILSMFFSS